MFCFYCRSIIGPKAVRNKGRVSVAEGFVHVQLQCETKYLPCFLLSLCSRLLGVIIKQLGVPWFLNVHFETAEAGNTNAECFQPNQKLGICG